MEGKHEYIIIGAGLAGASAINGIRQIDKTGGILLIGDERHLPYDRPPLSKKLWFGKKKVEEIFVNQQGFYAESGAETALSRRVVSIDAKSKTITDSENETYAYGKLLIATGGVPRRLSVIGGGLEGIYYYRNLDDYLRLKEEAAQGKSAVVIGGGFIGSEVAAALNINKLDVTMVFPSPYLCDKVLPEPLGMAIQARYIEKGVRILSRTRPASIAKEKGRFIVKMENGQDIAADIVVAGVGITPSVELAEKAGFETRDGIIVSQYLETTAPGVYAAGDNTNFPYKALGKRMRVEHWDNSRAQGLLAGRNMAGAKEPYEYMPYFFSDLYEFGYEAVGDVSSSLATFCDWQKENDTGVVYYLRDSKVVGVMNCNVWDKIETARSLIQSGATVAPGGLRGLIR